MQQLKRFINIIANIAYFFSVNTNKNENIVKLRRYLVVLATFI